MFRAFFSAAALLLASSALAQRGTPLSGSAPTTPLSGFPGTFDTFVPAKGSFVLNLGLPSGMPLDYGVTENFSLGVNGFVVVPLLLQAPSFSLKARVTASPTSWLTTAATGYTFFAKMKSENSDGKQETEAVLSYMATLNTSFFFSTHTWLNANLTYFDLLLTNGDPSSNSYSRVDENILLVAASGQHFFSDIVGVRLLGGLPLLATVSSDGGLDSTNELTGSATLEPGSSLYLLAFGFDFRLGNRWLLSPSWYSITANGETKSGLTAEGSYTW